MALSWLVVGSTRHHRAPSAVALTGALTVAVGLLPLRLDDRTDLSTKAAMGMAIAFGQTLAVLLGVCLRLYDRIRARESMRGVVAVLRNGEGVPSRSRPTPAEVVSEAVAAVTDTGLHPDLTLDERLAGRQLPAPVVDAARHVVREALTNVLRHAGEVTLVEVRARVCPDDPHLVQITVTDDGRAAATPLPGGGYGLAGLTERVAAVGGRP